MRLKIIVYFWSVGKKTRRKLTHKFKLIKNDFFNHNCILFKIINIECDKVFIQIRRNDDALIKEIIIKKGVKYYYRPMSMDAGYEYVIKITKFF